MSDNRRIERISSGVPLASNEYGVELSSIPRNGENHSIISNGSSLREESRSVMSRFQKIVKKFDFLKVEKRGIERVSPEDRNDTTIINTAMIWVGANIIVPCIAVGTLGPAVFQLDLYTSFITIFIFNIIGIIPIAAMACVGPASGLRTMTFSRYSLGYYGASIMSVVNIIAALGWLAVNSITGAQTLRVVSNDTLPMAIGIIIIALITMVISFVGYKWIHTYERYSWIPTLIGYCIVAGVGAKYFTHSDMASRNETTGNNSTGSRAEISRVLSFGTSCFGNAISWSSFSADYNTYFPEDTSQLKIFFFTYMGNFISIIPLQLLGAALYTGTYTNQNWADAYEKDNVGGLSGASLSSLGGFEKFLLVLFALSTVAGNIPNIYSLSLSAQVVTPIFKHIPRVIYTVIGTVIYVILSIFAASRFNESLISFMNIISYWFAIFITIVFEDHLIFRRCSYKNYDFDIWNNRRALPISIAAILSGFVGIVGIALGMSQNWFSGPIAKAIIGDTGEAVADVGFECGFVFTAVTFPLFRLIELRFVKR